MEGIVLKTALKTFNFVMLRQYCVQWVPSVSNRGKKTTLAALVQAQGAALHAD